MLGHFFLSFSKIILNLSFSYRYCVNEPVFKFTGTEQVEVELMQRIFCYTFFCFTMTTFLVRNVLSPGPIINQYYYQDFFPAFEGDRFAETSGTIATPGLVLGTGSSAVAEMLGPAV